MGRNHRRALVDHLAAVEAARETPGTWVLAGLYPNSQSAKTSARCILTGSPKFPDYEPVGAFEAYAAPAGEDESVWVRYVGDGPVRPLPDTMTVRIRHNGELRGYRTVTVAARCPACGGPRGWDTVWPISAPHRGDLLTVDRWTNPCGHQDTYLSMLRESRLRPIQQPVEPEPEPVHERQADEAEGPVALILAAASERRGMHAAQAALLIEEHGYQDAALAIRAEMKERRGHLSARQAVCLLRDLGAAVPSPSQTGTTTEMTA